MWVFIVSFLKKQMSNLAPFLKLFHQIIENKLELLTSDMQLIMQINSMPRGNKKNPLVRKVESESKKDYLMDNLDDLRNRYFQTTGKYMDLLSICISSIIIILFGLNDPVSLTALKRSFFTIN
jgi:hypothetical protein